MRSRLSILLASAALVLVAIVAVVRFGEGEKDRGSVAAEKTAPAAQPGDGRGAVETPGPEPVALPAAEEVLADLHDEDSDGVADLERLQHLLYLYRQAVGANPEGGENALIVESLLGANRGGLRFLPERAPYLDGEGRLVDRWGTPYFFHPLSGEEMEIVSAGPDAELWTGDDVTLP